MPRLVAVALLTLAGLIVAIPGSGAAPAVTGTSDWTQPGANSRHDNNNAGEHQLALRNLYRLHPQWWYAGKPGGPDQEDFTSLPAVAGGRAFFQTSTGTIEAHDAETGRQLWAAPEGPMTGTQPAVLDRHVVSTHKEGYSCCSVPSIDVRSAATGVREWSADGGLLAAGAGALVLREYPRCDGAGCHTPARLVARDPATGAVRWRVTGATSGGALSGGVFYYASGAGGPQTLRAVGVRSGAVLWSTPPPVRDLVPTAVDAPDSLLLAVRGTSVYALELPGGAVRWHRSRLVADQRRIGLAVAGGRLVTACPVPASYSVDLCVTDVRTGRGIRRVPAADFCYAATAGVEGITLANGIIWANVACADSEGNKVTALNAATGAGGVVIAETYYGQVVVADGKVWARDNRNLDVYGVSAVASAGGAFARHRTRDRGLPRRQPAARLGSTSGVSMVRLPAR